MLRLQTQRRPRRINLAAFPLKRPVQVIARVKLNAGLRRPHLHHAPARRLLHARRQTQLIALLIEHKIHVVAFAELQLFVALPDPRANRRRLAEIERSPRHRPQLPVGISPASTGVKRSAFNVSTWPRMSPPPFKLK